MCQVSRTTPVALKSVKILTVSKFDVLARFHETIPTVKFVSSPKSIKIPDFDRNYNFTNFHKIRIISGFTNPFYPEFLEG